MTMPPMSSSHSAGIRGEKLNSNKAHSSERELEENASSLLLRRRFDPHLGLFASLPPEIRNRVYALLFDDTTDMVVAPAVGSKRQFKLARLHDQRKYDALVAQRAYYVPDRLPAAVPLSHGITVDQLQLEARTYFFARQRFRVLSYGYEYLPIYVRWLDVMGVECRSVLRSLVLAGSMWYRPSEILTQQLHTLLRDCECLTSLEVQLNVRHLYERSFSGLEEFFDYIEEPSSDETTPRPDMKCWMQTITKLPALQKFVLRLVVGIDKKQPHYRKYEESERWNGELLARSVERQLKTKILEGAQEREIIIEAEFLERDEQRYRGLPWDIPLSCSI